MFYESAADGFIPCPVLFRRLLGTYEFAPELSRSCGQATSPRGCLHETFETLGKCPHRGKILEIGSGIGAVVWSVARNFGATPYANEPDPDAQEVLQRLGVRLDSQEKLSLVDNQNSYDLVILSHVLEHQPDPKPMLDLVLRQVAPGGLLLVEVPNGDVTEDGGVEHPLVFSRRSLASILRNYDCDVIW